MQEADQETLGLYQSSLYESYYFGVTGPGFLNQVPTLGAKPQILNSGLDQQNSEPHSMCPTLSAAGAGGASSQNTNAKVSCAIGTCMTTTATVTVTKTNYTQTMLMTMTQWLLTMTTLSPLQTMLTTPNAITNYS